MSELPIDLPRAIGRYTLLSLLGKGGMASVYKAEASGAQGFSRLVALKVVHKHMLSEPELVRSFIREAQLGGQLQHPNLVAALDAGELDGAPFIALEFVDGPTMHDLIARAYERSTRLPLDVVLQIFIQLCEGLDYAHSAMDRQGRPLGLVHRDLKPPNIFLSRHGVVKIGDFGVARARSVTGQFHHSVFLKGTMAYMSPEQAWGEDDLDGRADLFAVGAMLFEMLTIERLYDATRLEQLIRQAQDVAVEPRLSRVPAGPWQEPLLVILRKALAARREDRYRSAGEMATDLAALLKTLPEPVKLASWLKAWEEGTEITGEITGKTSPLAARLLTPASTEPTHPGTRPPVNEPSDPSSSTWVGSSSEYELISRKPVDEKDAMPSDEADPSEAEDEGAAAGPAPTLVATPAPPERLIVAGPRPWMLVAGMVLLIGGGIFFGRRHPLPEKVEAAPSQAPLLAVAATPAVAPSPTEVAATPTQAPATPVASPRSSYVPRPPIPAQPPRAATPAPTEPTAPPRAMDTPEPPPVGRGWLILDLRADIDVYIDGSRKPTRNRRVALEPGPHRIRVVRPVGEPLNESFDLKAGQRVICSLRGVLRQELFCS